MITFVTVIHVVVCVFLILVILLQAGKGGGMGAGLGGGGGSQTVFGGRGSQSFLGKVTSVSAGVFMLTSVWLAYHSSQSRSEAREQPAATQPAPAPAKDGGAPKDAQPAQPKDAQPAQPKDATPPAQPAGGTK